jgi:gamma-glutamylcysteine synthetase
MRSEPLRRHVAPLFRRGPRTARIGVEQELLAVDARTGGTVAVDRVRSAAAGAAYAPYLGFEPGGQVELSLPCAAGPDELGRQLQSAMNQLQADCGAAGIGLHAVPVDPRPLELLPLQLTSPRYVAMQRHFDTVGPAGRRMMRATASTQVCLDWWPGREGLEQWRVLNLAGPLLAAAFARSSGPEGRLTTWLAVDPSRTAFDDRLLRGDDPVAAYADWAAGATVFVDGGPEAHLTTLFPPVRPRGRYLEVRFLDVQEAVEVSRVAAVLSTLAYDADLRGRWLRRLEPRSQHLGDLWRAAAAGEPETAAGGLELAEAAGLGVAA